jgi:hypothetical protein
MTLTLSELSEIDLAVYPGSLVEDGDKSYFMAATPQGKRLCVAAPAGSPSLVALQGEASARGDSILLICPTSHHNASALRSALPWLNPTPLGLGASAGCGDRMGLATPGHIRAARAVNSKTGDRRVGDRKVGDAWVGMVFAQQSIREMTRTGRSPDEVMDDATWGIIQEGWREGMGADADHLKTTEDIDACVAAGFTFFTFDPGAHVDSAADTDDEGAIRSKYQSLPWVDLATTARDLQIAYAGKRFEVEDRALALDEPTLQRAAVKYGRAVAHVAAMYRHLTSLRPASAVELEVSVDETDTPTTLEEHLFIARELRRLGVRWVSLAPRYVGSFEKGVDYIGDLATFEADFAGHAAISRALGPYKLSLHTGSDKFRIYGIAASHARGLIHLKTAGTSYLEALRVTASLDPALFREILALAIERWAIDRASYHVSAQLSKVPSPGSLRDDELPGLLEKFDARQVLHIAFGSVLSSPALKERLFACLTRHEEMHYAALERHFVRHLTPLAGVA